MQTICKQLALALAILLTLSVAAGCGEQTDPSDSPQNASHSTQTPPPPADASSEADSVFPYTFTDSTGREVTLQAAPERVAVLMSSYAEIWNTVGGTVSITVGESVDRGFVDQDVDLVDDVSGKDIDTELLLSYEPDLVIGSADVEAQAAACELMAGAGIPSALFQVDNFDDYLSMLKICADITGDQDAYSSAGTEVGARIGAILSDVKDYLSSGSVQQPRILFIRAGSKYSSTKAKRAPDNFVCVMLDELGSYNIADNADILLDGLSLEEILREDPDYIFLTTMGSEEAAKSYIADLFSQDGWKDLTAVAEERYSFLPKDMFHFKPNARWADAYAHLARLLYPELELHG